MHWHIACVLLFIVIILFWFELEYAMPAWNITASNANKLECGMWKFATLCFSHIPYSYAVALSCCSHILYRWQGITLMLFLLVMFFQELNCVLPWLIIPVCKFLLVILEISPRFLQDKYFPSTRCCKLWMQWYRYIE